MAETLELDFRCPECHCSQWRKDEEAELYICARCDYVLAFDEDPDYEEELLDLGECGDCGFSGDTIYCSECCSTAVFINGDGYFECYDCEEQWTYGSAEPG